MDRIGLDRQDRKGLDWSGVVRRGAERTGQDGSVAVWIGEERQERRGADGTGQERTGEERMGPERPEWMGWVW